MAYARPPRLFGRPDARTTQDGTILAFKLLLTPALIGLASLAGRRWGPAVSGWLVGLPFTSGPVAFFIALSHGTAFASSVAAGTLVGTISQAAFCLAYAWLASGRGWPLAATAGCLAFAASTVALQPLGLPLALLFLPVIAALALALLCMPRDSAVAASEAKPLPGWDIPARLVAATVVVLVLTGLAPALGPRLTGLLAPFPLYAGILAVFAHHLQGPVAAIGVLRGLLLGLFSFAGFFFALAALLGRVGIGAAFACAIIVSLSLQGVSLWFVRRSQ